MRLIVIIFYFVSTFVHAQIAAFGDSIPAGTMTPGLGYPQVVGVFKNQIVTNYAVSGAQAADQADEIYGINGSTFTSSPNIIYHVGSGDERIYGTDIGKLANFETILSAEIYYLGSNITRSTSWLNNGFTANSSYTIGMVSHTNGSTLNTTFNGDVLLVGYIIQDGQNGQFSVTIDGIYKQTITVSNGSAIATLNGRTYAPALLRIAGNGLGSHTVTFEVISTTGQYVDIDWISNGPSTSAIFQGNILLETAAAYAASGGSAKNTATYNSAIQSIITQAQSDGININFINISSTFNPSVCTLPDGIHPTYICQVDLSIPFINAF